MYINDKGELVEKNNITEYDTSGNDITKHYKYKVNTKTGLFEEVKKQEQTTYTGIETLGLSPRTLNALINAEILSIEKLKTYTEIELRKFKGIGNKAIRELALSQLKPY